MTCYPLNIPRNQRLKEEHYNLVLSTPERIISDRSSQLKSTKEDNPIPIVGYSKVVANANSTSECYNNVLATFF